MALPPMTTCLGGGFGGAAARSAAIRPATLLALAAAGLACGCSAGQSLSDKSLPPRAAVQAEVERDFGGYVETIAVARLAGYDYLEIVADCLLRDRHAMNRLFEMTAKADFDAASSEGNANVLGFVLRDVGDRFFGQCLDAAPPAVRTAVREQLLYDMGCDGDYEAKGEDIHLAYPHTFPDPRRL